MLNYCDDYWGDTYYCVSCVRDEKEHLDSKMFVVVPSTVGWGCSWCGGWAWGITGRRGRCSVWWRSWPLNTNLGPSCTSQTPLSKQAEHRMFKTRRGEEKRNPLTLQYRTKKWNKMEKSLPYVVICRWPKVFQMVLQFFPTETFTHKAQQSHQCSCLLCILLVRRVFPTCI